MVAPAIEHTKIEQTRLDALLARALGAIPLLLEREAPHQPAVGGEAQPDTKTTKPDDRTHVPASTPRGP